MKHSYIVIRDLTLPCPPPPTPSLPSKHLDVRDQYKDNILDVQHCVLLIKRTLISDARKDFKFSWFLPA